MDNYKKCVFVVSLIEAGQKVYFVREEITPIEIKGYFSIDLVQAKKFINKEVAEIIASAYKGAGVECIKEGERLK